MVAKREETTASKVYIGISLTKFYVAGVLPLSSLKTQWLRHA